MAESNFALRCNTHRGYVLRVAVLQLHNNDIAEDVVQDTLMAALQGAQGFSGARASRLAHGVLKHKVSMRSDVGRASLP